MWLKIALALVLLLAACAPAADEPSAASSASPTTGAEAQAAAVPRAFRRACGKPGSEVRIRKVPVTVRHADCDLSGVTIIVRGRGGAVVPDPGIGVGNSSGLSVTRDEAGDVTVDAQGPAGDI